MHTFILLRADGGFTVRIDSIIPEGALLITRAEYDGLLNGTHVFNGQAVVEL